jgi:hypothetical protein
MRTDRKVSMVALVALASVAVTACSDGGPPGPFHRPSTRDAPTIAADGGEQTPNADDADAGEASADAR